MVNSAFTTTLMYNGGHCHVAKSESEVMTTYFFAMLKLFQMLVEDHQ